ncbi:MAG: serine/threonine protein phosphatase [Myxococcales bacterium]|nr:serine/threonine protein phosphatase [Myxococcales bacterium]
MPFRIRAFGMSDVGRAREQNEDNFMILPEEGLYVVADGMGGHASGQLASALAVARVSEFICIEREKPGFSWPFQVRKDRTWDGNSLACSIQFANERIFVEACKDPSHEGMGTTAVAVLKKRDEDTLVIGHVGDSRIYRYRNDGLYQMTEDHSLLNHLLNTGQIDPAEADNFARKNVIFRALGLKDHVDVDIAELAMHNEDIFLMCSDGLTDLVEDWVIAEVISNCRSDLQTAVDTLIRMANHNGGTDNITIVMLYLEEIADA